MLNKRKNEFEELLKDAESCAASATAMASATAEGKFSAVLGRIMGAATREELIAAIMAAIDAFASKLPADNSLRKWATVVRYVVQIVAFVIGAVISARRVKK